MKALTSTYRLQLREEVGFAAARELVDYLDALGVSHAYASPYMAAEPGSTHGYDLVDPNTLAPELGGERDFLAWTTALAAKGMGHIVDVVPNHMAATTRNAWWRDVLENGPSSLYANHFDVEWHPPKEALENKVLLPLLGAQYGECLEAGELRLERQGAAFVVRCAGQDLPIDPQSTVPLLERAAASLRVAEDDARRQELESILTGLRNLPSRLETEPARQQERAREKEVLKRRLAALAEHPHIRECIDAAVAAMNGAPGEPRSFDALDELLLEQSYRLAFWRVATEEINYRRFFDVNGLAAIRMETDAVFDDALGHILRLVEAGHVQGVRLDHTDGLHDPAGFFVKLRRALTRAGNGASAGGEYLVVEKILAPGEPLPNDWAVDGTTGYDFLAQVSGLFVDPAAEAPLTRMYQELTGDRRTFAEHALDAKRATMRSTLSSEIYMTATRLERIAMRDRRSRDFTLPALRRALTETIAAFPVYRTYLNPDASREPRDEAIITRAIRVARRRNPEISPSVFEFLRDVLLLTRAPIDEHDRDARAELAMRFQQLTGPVMAKSVEDTAFYSYARFIALNEVGASPERFGTSIDEFHAANAARRRDWPRTMTTLGTHDTKRGADVRARLAVLSEIPETWARWVEELSREAARYVVDVEGEPAPSAVDQYLFLQTAIGAHPLAGGIEEFIPRVAAYARKAAREAKQHTSWVAPDEIYEQALERFVTGALRDEAFAASLAEKADALATHGASNGLAQLVLQLASPGVADTYQGAELWDLRLVDPDNRALVDYEERRAALAALAGARPRELLEAFRDGRVKLHVLRAGLALRRERPRVLIDGDYVPIDAGEDIVAFARQSAEGSVACAVARRPYRVTRGSAPWAVGALWGDRRIAVPEGRWRDTLTDALHVIGRDGALAADLFADLPVCLLASA